MREHLTKLQDYDREKGRQRRNQENCEKIFFKRGSVWPCRYSLHRKLISKRQVSIRHHGSQSKDQIQKQLEIHGKLEMIRSNCKKSEAELEEQGSTDPAGKNYQTEKDRQKEKEEDYRTVEIVGNTSNPSGTKQTAQRAVEGAGRNFKTPSIHAGRNLQEGDRVRKSSQTIARRTLQER